MQKTTFIFLVFILPMNLIAQQFSIEYGKTISAFDYKNSDGEKIENMLGSTDNHLAIAFGLPLGESDFYFYSSLAYSKYGAQQSDEALNNYHEWKVNYAGLKLGIGYEFFKLSSQRNYRNTNSEESFTFYVQMATGAELMVQGSQITNSRVYNLKGVEQFDKPKVFALGGIGGRYYASKSVSVFLQYMGGKSFSVFKSDTEDSEKLHFINHTISLGVAIILPLQK
jgi:hypothetical protein